MAANEALADRVRATLKQAAQFEEKSQFEEKTMFGGIAFMVRGKLCVTVGRDRLMCRIDPAAHETALIREGCRTVVMKGRQYRGYVYVDAEAVKLASDLDYWIGLSLDYNGKAKASSRKRR